MSAGFYASGDSANGTLLPGQRAPDQVTPIYAATEGYISRPEDSLPNTWFDGRVQNALGFERSMLSAAGVGGRVVTGWGEMTIDNRDGFYDGLAAGGAIDGRRIVVRLGGPDFTYDDFGKIFDGTGADWTFSESLLRIRLRDNNYRLEVPIQSVTYEGTGGLEGGDELKGKPKPLAFGRVRNVTGAYIDPPSLTWQFNNGPIQAVDAVRDRGVDLPFSADYGSYAALVAAVIPAGHYATCLARGLVRLASPPDGAVTADLRGSAANGIYVESAADIMLRIIEDYVGIPAAEIDRSAFLGLAAAVPDAVGLMIGTEATLAVASLDQLARSVGAFYGYRRDGLLAAALVRPPGSPAAIYTPVEILSIDREPLPPALSPALWKARVGYRVNWTLQPDDIAGSVSQETRAWLREKHRVAERSDTAVVARHLLAPQTPVIETLLDTESAAATLASRQLELYAPGRALYRVQVKTQPFKRDLGETIRLVYPRWDLVQGKDFLIVRISEEASRNVVELTVFG